MIGTVVLIILMMFLLYAFLPSYYNKQRFFKKPKPQKKEIYLTFDDGPSEYTQPLLELLKKYHVKATFFCVANFAIQHKETIEKMKQDGHVIALHSLKHKNAMLQGVMETKSDLEKSLAIMNQLGVSVKYYRPPWGDSNYYLLKSLKRKNIECILWNVMAEDWEADTTEQEIANKLLTRTNPRRYYLFARRKRQKASAAKDNFGFRKSHTNLDRERISI